jgi:hypothetical protein
MKAVILQRFVQQLRDTGGGQQPDASSEADLLLALPTCLDEVESFSYDADCGLDLDLTLTGTKHHHEIVVEVHFAPFEDDEANNIFDANAGTWRDKTMDED